MSPSSTSLSLIRRIGLNDQMAWHRLSHIYGPLVYRWCRRRGIKSDDASDIMQEVMQAVSASIDRYRSNEGRQSFRGWLYGIAAHKINDHFRQTMKREEIQPGTGFEFAAADSDRDSFSETGISQSNDRKLVIHRTLATIREEFADGHWQAFWRTAVDGQTAPFVAQELGMSAASVRQAKCRVSKRIREQLDELEDVE